MRNRRSLLLITGVLATVSLGAWSVPSVAQVQGGVADSPIEQSPASLAVRVDGGTLITARGIRQERIPFGVVPYRGSADAPISGAFDTTKRTGTPVGNRASFVPVGDPWAEIVVQAPPGVRLSTSVGSAWNEGTKTLTVRSGTTVYAHAVLVGTHSVQFTEGAETITAQFRVTTVAAAAYNISLVSPQELFTPYSEGVVGARITDVFGNPVPGSAPSDEVNNSVEVSANGEVLLRGFSTRDTIEFDANGKAEVGIVTGARGSAYLSAVPSTKSNVPAWRPGYTPPLDAPPPVIAAGLELPIGAVAPSPPAALQAIAVPGGVKVSWQAPKSSGSTPVESYSVTASPGGHSCTAKVLTCTLEGLTLGPTGTDRSFR